MVRVGAEVGAVYIDALTRLGRADMAPELYRRFIDPNGPPPSSSSSPSSSSYTSSSYTSSPPPPSGSPSYSSYSPSSSSSPYAQPRSPRSLYEALSPAPGLIGVRLENTSEIAQAVARELGARPQPKFPSFAWAVTKLWWGFMVVLKVGVGVFLIFWLVLPMIKSASDRSPLSSILGNNAPAPETSEVRFTDVLGADEAKHEMELIVDYLKDSNKYESLGGRFPKGVLMSGPPGTGKTLLARAVAGEAGVPFFYMSGSEMEEVFVGVGAKRVRDLFAAAKAAAPCIIFFDEIDAVGGKRSNKEGSTVRQTLNQLLSEMDGFRQTPGIIVIGATNFAEVLDPALTRAGRFDMRVTLSAPDLSGRTALAKHYFSKIKNVASDVDPITLARGTPGLTGADIANIVNSAAIHAASAGRAMLSMSDVEFAKDKILMGPERKSQRMTKESLHRTAVHEAGHALVALSNPEAMPVYKATIMPRGGALGYVAQLPKGDIYSVTHAELEARLDICMAGRVAEEVFFGSDQVSTGASSDFAQATETARNMAMRYGFSEKIGPIYVSEEAYLTLSEERKRVVDLEVDRQLSEANQRATRVIVQNKDTLLKISSALEMYETLSGKDIDAIIKGQPFSPSHQPSA
jgi:ATP-dependent metalloprotease